MELIVHTGEISFRISDPLDRFEQVDHLSGRILDRHAGVFRRKQKPDMQQVGYEIRRQVLLLAGDRREDEQIPLFPVIAYAGGAPVVDLKPSVARKALKRFTQGGAGDAELFSQFAFGG